MCCTFLKKCFMNTNKNLNAHRRLQSKCTYFKQFFFLSISMPFKDIWIGMNEKDFLRNENWLGLLCGLGIRSFKKIPLSRHVACNLLYLCDFFHSCWLFVIDKKKSSDLKKVLIWSYSRWWDNIQNLLIERL